MCPRCKRSTRRESSPTSSGSSRSRRSPSPGSRASRSTRRPRSSPSCCATRAATFAWSTCPARRRRVLADFPGPGPTVLLYAHYDVQPAPRRRLGDRSVRADDANDGRLYGRGAADDKSGIAAHLAALRAFGGKPPVHVKILDRGLGGERAPEAARGRRPRSGADARGRDRRRRQRQLEGGGADAVADPARPRQAHGDPDARSRPRCTPATSAAPRPTRCSRSRA